MNALSSNTNRRQFLRASGVTFGLPLLDSILPHGLRAAEVSTTPGFTPDGKPRRMVCICNHLGLHAPFYVPEGQGRGWKASRYLKAIEEFRDQMTVFSGVSHPEVDGGHNARKSFLTTAPHPGGGSFKNSISLDQFAADYIGRETRFSSLMLSTKGSNSLSWTRAGVPIPATSRASEIFRKLFLTGNADEVDAQILKLRMGQSIMDSVLDQAKSIHRRLDHDDQAKFDEYMTSVREVEQQMVRQQEWEKKPKPKPSAKLPKDVTDPADVIGSATLMYDLIHLALETDSTRLVTLETHGDFIVPPVEGVTEGYHTLSHHGQNPKKIEQLALIEIEHMRALNRLLTKLNGTKEQGETLLDRTMVLYGSVMGNASSHDNRNLPFLLAGGGFQHGQHLGFDPEDNHPIGTLFVTMLQRLGIEADRFGSATATMKGLEMA